MIHNINTNKETYLGLSLSDTNKPVTKMDTFNDYTDIADYVNFTVTMRAPSIRKGPSTMTMLYDS